MFILLGQVGYARLMSPTALGLDTRVSYAEHAVTDGKPLLQFMGAELDKLDLDFCFHVDFCDPAMAWADLMLLRDSRMAFPVVMGTGKYLGYFVITDLSRNATRMSENGELESIDCSVRMREYVDAKQLQTREEQQRQKAKAVTSSGTTKPRMLAIDIPSVPPPSSSGGYAGVSRNTIVRQA